MDNEKIKNTVKVAKFKNLFIVRIFMLVALVCKQKIGLAAGLT